MRQKNYNFIILLLFCCSSIVKSQDQLVDSLINSLKNSTHDTIKLSTLVELSNVCPEEDVQKYSWQAINLSERLYKSNTGRIKLLAKKLMGDATNNFAYGYQTKGEIDSALFFYEKSYFIRKEINDYVGIGESLNNIGYLFEQKGNISKALENYHLALKHYELGKSKRGLAYALNNLGFVYQKQGDLNKALEYYLKSKALREEIGDKHGLSQSLTNVGAIYKLQKNYDEALKTHFRSLEIQKELGDQSGISNSFNNIGYIYENNNDLDKALDYYKKSLSIREQIQEKKGMANSLNNIGRIYLLKKDYKKSLEAANRSYELSKDLGFPENIKNASKLLAVLYKKEGKYKETVEMLEEYFKMHDSLNNESTRRNTAKQQLQYEFSKKAIADSVKYAEEQKVKDAQINAQQAQIASDKSKRWALYGGLFLVLVFGIVMFNRFKLTQRQKSIIEKQKQHVEFQKEIVDQKQKEILDSINYAKRIQYTLLAHQDLLKEYLTDYFILFKPKDIVSGDFYWATQKGNLFYLAVCDSTGHGVPGAFMSLLNISFMNEAINEKNISEPNKILDYVRDRLINSISIDGAQDGMEGVLLCFNQTTNALTYAASQNVPVLVRNQEIIKLPVDKMPIGKGILQENFNLFSIDVLQGDMIYLYTDGFADQFGGEKGKKFKYNRLNQLLIENSLQTTQIQIKEIENVFDTWKGNMEQVDDVLLIGIRI